MKAVLVALCLFIHLVVMAQMPVPAKELMQERFRRHAIELGYMAASFGDGYGLKGAGLGFRYGFMVTKHFEGSVAYSNFGSTDYQLNGKPLESGQIGQRNFENVVLSVRYNQILNQGRVFRLKVAVAADFNYRYTCAICGDMVFSRPYIMPHSSAYVGFDLRSKGGGGSISFEGYIGKWFYVATGFSFAHYFTKPKVSYSTQGAIPTPSNFYDNYKYPQNMITLQPRIGFKF